MRCCVPSCPSSARKNRRSITYFPFPKKRKVKEEWIQVLIHNHLYDDIIGGGRGSGGVNDDDKISRLFICSRHFCENDFKLFPSSSSSTLTIDNGNGGGGRKGKQNFSSDEVIINNSIRSLKVDAIPSIFEDSSVGVGDKRRKSNRNSISTSNGNEVSSSSVCTRGSKKCNSSNIPIEAVALYMKDAVSTCKIALETFKKKSVKNWPNNVKLPALPSALKIQTRGLKRTRNSRSEQEPSRKSSTPVQVQPSSRVTTTIKDTLSPAKIKTKPKPKDVVQQEEKRRTRNSARSSGQILVDRREPSPVVEVKKSVEVDASSEKRITRASGSGRGELVLLSLPIKKTNNFKTQGTASKSKSTLPNRPVEKYAERLTGRPGRKPASPNNVSSKKPLKSQVEVNTSSPMKKSTKPNIQLSMKIASDMVITPKSNSTNLFKTKNKFQPKVKAKANTVTSSLTTSTPQFKLNGTRKKKKITKPKITIDSWSLSEDSERKQLGFVQSMLSQVASKVMANGGTPPSKRGRKPKSLFASTADIRSINVDMFKRNCSTLLTGENNDDGIVNGSNCILPDQLVDDANDVDNDIPIGDPLKIFQSQVSISSRNKLDSVDVDVDINEHEYGTPLLNGFGIDIDQNPVAISGNELMAMITADGCEYVPSETSETAEENYFALIPKIEVNEVGSLDDGETLSSPEAEADDIVCKEPSVKIEVNIDSDHGEED